MTDVTNLEAWAMENGYNPDTDYTDDDKLPDHMLSEHFSKAEFACNCCGRLHPSGTMPPQSLVNDLEALRAHFGKPVNINSGYRCPSHNAAVDGATSSRHMEGDAADVWIAGVDPDDVYAWADKRIGDGGGVGSYNTFTHIDRRGYKARW